MSATPAAKWVMQHWEELTPEQQHIVAGRLGLENDDGTVRSGLKLVSSVTAFPRLSPSACNSLDDLLRVPTREAPKEFADLVTATRPKVETLVGVNVDAQITVWRSVSMGQ